MARDGCHLHDRLAISQIEKRAQHHQICKLGRQLVLTKRGHAKRTCQKDGPHHRGRDRVRGKRTTGRSYKTPLAPITATQVLQHNEPNVHALWLQKPHQRACVEAMVGCIARIGIERPHNQLAMVVDPLVPYIFQTVAQRVCSTPRFG